MEIRQLRYFIALADTLNYSRAAESLYISQSALSRQIAELEREIGTVLFLRTTRSVELTPAGRALQLRAKDLISGMEKMIPEIRRMSAPGFGGQSLIIGTDSRALAQPERRNLFLGMLFRLRREYPGIRILMRYSSYPELLRGLTEGDLGCALVLDRNTEPRSDLCRTILGSEEMVLAFRSRNPHTDADYAEVISNRGLILPDHEPQGLYHIIHILNDLRLEPQIRFCESMEDMTMTVQTGESAMILPASVFDRLADPSLCRLRLPTESAKLSLSLIAADSCTNPMVPVLRDSVLSLFGVQERNSTSG